MSEILLSDAIRIAADGDAILFVGAGIGFLTEGLNGKLPDGAKLSNRILDRDDDAPAPPPLDKAVGFAIRKKLGVEDVYNTLRSNLSVKHVDPRLAELYSLPWRRIYTTNYDEAIEVSRSGKQPTNSCVLEDGTELSRAGSVIHLNGRLSSISPSSLERGLSLSDRSYVDRNLERSPWYSYFSRDLETARAVIFVGYSLYDLDISRLIFSTDISGKTFFFVSPDIDEVERESISIFGQVHDGGVVALFESAQDALSDYTPVKRGVKYTSLRAIGEYDEEVGFEPSRVLDAQLVFGILPERQTIEGTAVFGDRQFVIQRSQQRDAFRALQRGLFRDILITGEFVSGKTGTALSMAAEFIRQGYKAYFATHGNRLSDELAHLASVDDRVVVIFEGYATFRSTIREYARRRNPKHRLILTEQAVQHELYGEFVFDPVLAGQVFELTLDRISEEDSTLLAGLIDFGGYWRERSGASDDTNARYITGKLEGSLYRVLMEVVESQDVQRRIDSILYPILASRRATEVFVAACIVNVLGVQFRISDWVSVFEPQFVKSVLRNYSEEIKYFLLVQSGNVFPRSGLLSSSILKRITDRGIIVDAALKLYSVSAKSRQPYNFYDDVFIRLMQFNRLQPIMRGSDEKDLIFRFYENIRPVAGTHKNPDYWLQLGIAATAFDDLNVAGDAFQNAYAREEKAKKPNFKRIDNYYNRYLLKYSASMEDSQSAYSLFMGAISGLTKQMFLEDNRHYPFKSGRVYGEIARKHFESWTSEQRERFIAETRSIREKAVEYERDHKGQSVDVEVLIRETGELLSRLSPN